MDSRRPLPFRSGLVAFRPGYPVRVVLPMLSSAGAEMVPQAGCHVWDAPLHVLVFSESLTDMEDLPKKWGL